MVIIARRYKWSKLWNAGFFPPSFCFVSFYDEAFERLFFFLSRNTCKMGLMLTLILLLIRWWGLQRMKRSLTAEGRGRRVALKRQTVLNNKLLLQLDLLRKTCEKSWAEMDSFFSTVCNPQHLAHTSLKLEVDRASRGAAAVDSPDIEAFLDVDVGRELEIRSVDPFLQKLGIKRHHLLSSSFQDLPCANVPVTNGTIIDLMIFQKDEGLPLQKEWYIFVGLDISDLSDKQLRDRLKKTRQPYDSMSKHLSRQNITEKLRAFLFRSPSYFQLRTGSEQPSLPQTPDQPTIPPIACTSIASACLGRQMAALRRKVEHMEGELTVSKTKQETLKEIALERAVGLQQLETNLLLVENERDIATGHLSEEKEKVLQLLQDGSVIHQDLNASHAEVVTLKKQNVNRLFPEPVLLDVGRGGGLTWTFLFFIEVNINYNVWYLI